MKVLLSAEKLSKAFNRRIIFENVTIGVREGETLLITGRNGSGKSTLLKILAGILTPTSGAVLLDHPDRPGTSAADLIGFVSPYLNLYEEFSARENLSFAMSVRSFRPSRDAVDRMLDRVGLSRFMDTPARFYSSGMKQRLKYAFALIHQPALLMLDEPTSNLDKEGKDFVREIMEEQRRTGCLVVATNEQDVPTFDHSLTLGNQG